MSLPSQQQVIADTVRRQFRTLLKAQLPVVWASRSARTSLSNHVWQGVQQILRALDAEAQGPAPLTPEEIRQCAALVQEDLEGYWRWMYAELSTTAAPGFLARFWRDVEAQIRATLEDCAWPTIP